MSNLSSDSISRRVLIANRGEIADRIDRAVRSLGWVSQHVHTVEETRAVHPGSHLLPKPGIAGYLDVDGIVDAALRTASDLVHPGYGFLAESADLAEACRAAGIEFVGPDADALRVFGDKGRAKAHALGVGVPTLDATGPDATREEIEALLERHPRGVMIKAVHGGGGRGMRVITGLDELDATLTTCRSEAMRAFGDPAVYAERLMANAKHIEIQVVGDGTGHVVALGDRDCSVQRRHQKIIEIAPSPHLSDADRTRLAGWAKALLEPLAFRGLATVEFLVAADPMRRGEPLDAAFIEVNPRLQVEHTITEEISGVDLVRTQLLIAEGATLASLGLDTDMAPAPGVWSIQTRVNAETLHRGALVATSGTVTGWTTPSGVRVDSGITEGTVVDGTFDSLLAKVVTRTEGDLADACDAARAALDAVLIQGVETNVDLLRELTAHQTLRDGDATTSWLDELLRERGRSANDEGASGEVTAALNGTVVAVAASQGDTVGPRTPLITLESMKMEHPVTAGHPGVVKEVFVEVGDVVTLGQPLAWVEPDDSIVLGDESHEDIDLDLIRPDLARVQERLALTQDAARPEAVAKRHARGHLTAREWIDLLVDQDSFVEYGALAVAAQRGRRSEEDLIANTPADGIITGTGSVNGDADHPRPCAVLAYDYTVLAGTQGYFSHKKADRVLQVARDRRLPVILFAEGGGGRPGDTDSLPLLTAGLNVGTFAAMGALSGVVPTIGILTGRCFAGNAALLGSCDVIIATEDSNLGMAGPAMIEGGGLGVFTPEEIGPMTVQAPNGVVDIVVADDAEAIATARRYLSYFQGHQTTWSAADQRRLRHAVGENRKQVYDIRELIEILVDEGSILELRRSFGVGAVTALVRIEGRPYGLIANDPGHLGGAIDAEAADKMARFIQLCDAHGLPIVSLCDTPGFMVGPEAEQTATVRHFSRLFVIAAHTRVPMITVVVRKAYGLGAQAMAAGGFAETTATIAWPTGEIGAMGLEGAVRLGFSKELAAIENDEERAMQFDELVAQHYEAGRAINGAMKLELDAVIDPADTRRWIVATIGDWDGVGSGRFIDTW